MALPDLRSERRLTAVALVLTTTFACAPSAIAAEAAAFRYDAPIEVRSAAPFVELPLSAEVYARAAQPGLGDLRVVDAAGERVPFAFLAAPAAMAASERIRNATLYPLPTRSSASGAWPSPVDVVVDGDRISVRRRAGVAAASTPPTPPTPSGGWLIDTGERSAGEAPPRALRLAWSGPAEFSTRYRIDTSDDLRSWRDGGSGPLMALQSASAGTLTQPLVPLRSDAGRFVRLVWAEPSSAPSIVGASVLTPERGLVASPASAEIIAEPLAASSPQPADASASRAVEFDLGGALPLVDLDLRFAAGNHVAPMRVQGRVDAVEAWRDLGAGVFYRLERDGSIGESPALALPATVRFVRLLADERSPPLDPRQLRLVVHAQLASLVFVAQGQPPFHLLAGSRDAPAVAMQPDTLVPHLADERPRFGQATIGRFSEVDVVARADELAQQRARWRPWLLWIVLVAGVAALALLVWRLAKNGDDAGTASS